MKRVAFALLVLLLAAGCGAASIEVQESVPASTVWSFSVTLPNAVDFDDAKVLLNGSNIASFYTYNGKIKFEEDDIDRAKVFSNTEPVSNRVYFLVSPLAKGTHTLKLEVDGAAADEKSVEFFEIYDAEGNADLQDQVTSVRGSVNSLVEQFNELEGGLANALGAEDKAELNAGIAEVESALSSLEAAVEEKGSERDAKINALNGYLQQLEARESEQEMQAGTGFFSIPGIGMEMQALLLIAVVAAAAAFLVVKFRDRIPMKKGLYGKMKIMVPSFSNYDDDITEQAMKAAQKDGPDGKWAFGSEARKEEAHEGFGIGSLIKK